MLKFLNVVDDASKCIMYLEGKALKKESVDDVQEIEIDIKVAYFQEQDFYKLPLVNDCSASSPNRVILEKSCELILSDLKKNKMVCNLNDNFEDGLYEVKKKIYLNNSIGLGNYMLGCEKVLNKFSNCSEYNKIVLEKESDYLLVAYVADGPMAAPDGTPRGLATKLVAIVDNQESKNKEVHAKIKILNLNYFYAIKVF